MTLDDLIAAERAACPDTYSEAWRHRCEVFHCARIESGHRQSHFQGMRDKGRDPEQVAALEAATNALLAELGAGGLPSTAQGSRRAGKPTRHATTHGAPWTPELDRTLAELAKAGTRVPDLSSRFGRSQRAIEMRLERLGIAVAACA